MPPHTRRITLEENRTLRSKKVPFVKNVQITLSRCDKKKSLSPRKKPTAENVVKSSRKSLTPSNSPQSNNKQNQNSPVANSNRKLTKLEGKKIDEKRSAVKNDTHKSKSKSTSPKSVNKSDPAVSTKPKKSPMKPVTLANLKLSPKKSATLKNVERSSNRKSTTDEETSKSDLRLKKPLAKKALFKGTKLKKQLKLGRIYINPTFPIRTVLKTRIHSDDKEENQGQLVTINSTAEMIEQNNNNIGSYIVQPKIVLHKIDVQAEKPIREMRKILRLL